MCKISKKQVETILLTTPGPLGAGLKLREVGMLLGITKDAVKKRIGRFKKKYPAAWSNIMSIRGVASRQRENLEHPLRWEKDHTETWVIQKF